MPPRHDPERAKMPPRYPSDRSWAALGRSWAALGRSWAGLGRSWVALGSLLAALGRSWPLLGPLLSRPWLLLGHSWPPLGPPDQAGPATEAQDWSKTAHRGPKNEPRLPTEAQEVRKISYNNSRRFEILNHRNTAHIGPAVPQRPVNFTSDHQSKM